MKKTVFNNFIFKNPHHLYREGNLASPAEQAAFNKEVAKIDAEQQYKEALKAAEAQPPRESLKKFARRQIDEMHAQNDLKLEMNRAIRESIFEHSELEHPPRDNGKVYDITQGNGSISEQDMEDPSAAINELLKEQAGLNKITDSEVDDALDELNKTA